MRLITQTPKKALKAFLKQKPLRSEINVFKRNLITLLDKISIIEKRPRDESEEHLKNDLRDFLRDTYYRDTNAINTKDKKDLVIHLGKTTNSEVGVIIEAKRPNNINEMVSADHPNKKALHELILYYLDERHQAGNNQMKQLVMTNVNEWYIIDANYFDKHIYRNTQIKKLYETKLNDKKDNPFFYEEVAKIILEMNVEIPCVYFDIREYDTILRNNKKEDDRELIALFKILSPQHLLKIATPNDNNSLDERFYKELLHIIGLEEAKENGKNIIRRKQENRNVASLIEATIDALNAEDVLHHLPDQTIYGENKEERIFNISLELCITWINRILFLKLLEGQLITYHQGNNEYRFLNSATINDFDELFKLFHKVLAVNLNDRTEAIKNKYSRVPYLNSSLFEINKLEDKTIKINSLDNSGQLELIGTTILKDIRKKVDKLPMLDYLFNFLDAYDFASEGAEDVQEDNKTIINASVLGKVFEKINGYKDGSIFTPAFITMYMCKQSIRLSVVEKFSEYCQSHDLSNLKITRIEDVYELIGNKLSRQQANEIVNSLKICDPAVGSGHFLVSALNEIISIKSELNILMDKNGKTLRDYEIEIINDELIITDENSNIFAYNPNSKESNRIQKTLFHEKQTIIENCLFGVDINPNSVKICRLRLWIELLKNAYYKEESNYLELETLPNIDINIKCGNSLLSRFALNADLSKALKSIKYDVKAYRGFVNDYKNEKSRDVKRGLQKIIDSIKNDFRTEISNNDPKQIKLKKLNGELFTLLNQGQIFELTDKEKKAQKEKQTKLETDISKLDKEIEEIKSNAIYKNAFEWRFQFPEVLGNDGEYEGFDLIIGNPPYIQLQKLNENTKRALEQQQFETFTKTGDIYQLFYEQGVRLLKENGQLSYITSNKWMRTDYGKGTRSFLANKYRTILMVDFGMAQLFESATTYTNILLLEKKEANSTIRMCRVKDDYDENILLEDYVDFAAVEMENPGDKSWIAYEKKEYTLIKKIIEQGKPLKEWDIQINRGILTGYNEAFIIDTETRDKLVAEDAKSGEIVKPILRGEDIKAYVPQWAGLWVIGTFPSLNIELNEYPAIENYLTQYKERLTPKPKNYSGKFGTWIGRKSGSYEWFETQDSISYYDDFLKPKIIYPNMTKFMPFVYDKHQFFTNQKCFIITGNFLSYLTAFLNSKTFRFTFKEYFPELLGDTRELSKVFFETVAIKTVDEQTNQIFEVWIETIIELKLQGKSTKHIEREIERKLAEIYSLSEKEMRLIDSSENTDGETFPDTIALSESVNL
jgi:adenine-specific DNA-methyltransferase